MIIMRKVGLLFNEKGLNMSNGRILLGLVLLLLIMNICSAEQTGDVRDGDSVVRPGDTLLVTLHWQAAAVPDGDYSVFVHLLASDDTLVAQQDNVPLRGTYPTFLWEPAERVDDPHELVVPFDAPDGLYRLQAGMYDWRTGERLAATVDCEEPVPDESIPLASIKVRRQGVTWWQVLAMAMAGTMVLGGVVVPLRRGTRSDNQ